MSLLLKIEVVLLIILTLIMRLNVYYIFSSFLIFGGIIAVVFILAERFR